MPSAFDANSARIPTSGHRLMQDSDLGAMVLLLVSDQGAAVTGCVFPGDDGQSL